MSPELVVAPTTTNPLVAPPVIDFGPWADPVLHWFVSTFPAAVSIIKHTIGLLIGLSFPLAAVFLIALIYTVEQLKRVRTKESQIYDLKVEPAYEAVPAVSDNGTTPEPDETLAKRWRTVADHINSTNPNDWKQAIIEADIMLDDVLSKLGYQGDGVGEKLKRAEPADFATLQDAWEAHKVRNQIAHEGSAFALNEHEAKRVYNLYKKVFEEFYYL